MHLVFLRSFHDLIDPDHTILHSIHAFLLLLDQLLQAFKLLIDVLLDLLELRADNLLVKLLLSRFLLLAKLLGNVVQVVQLRLDLFRDGIQDGLRVMGCLGRLLLESGGRSLKLHLQIFKFRCQHIHLLIMSGLGRG